MSIARSRPRVRPARRSTRRRLARIAGRPTHPFARYAPHRDGRRVDVVARSTAVHPGIAARSARQRRPGLRLAVLVRWHGAELDRRLAAGEDPRTSEALALRADRITAARHRARLAAGLAGAARSARAGRAAFTAAVRSHNPDVLEASALIATIERRLRDPEPVAPRGVAIVGSLLVDGNSPLYRPGEPGVLGSRLRAAAAALGAPPADP